MALARTGPDNTISYGNFWPWNVPFGKAQGNQGSVTVLLSGRQ